MPKGVNDFQPEDRRRVRTRLLQWYDRAKRDLPWRRRADNPYAQLLAEFMLQQTQVATVIPYYDRFIERFPTVTDLADADIDDVLAHWSGLGYYSRARNLHRTARAIRDDHAAVVPRTVDALIRLTGIGRYTAGAIASVAYDVRAPIVDGNVTRVFMRLLAIDDDPKSPAVQTHLWSVAESLLPRKRTGDFNQALMELGATVCTPRSPNCLLCPLNRACEALRTGKVEQIPRVARRTAVLPQTFIVAAIQRGDSLLFTQRPNKGLWAGLWELPSLAVNKGGRKSDAVRQLAQQLTAYGELTSKPMATVSRQLTHRKVTFHIYAGQTTGKPSRKRFNQQPTRWLTSNQLPDVGISRACEAILRKIEWSPSSA